MRYLALAIMFALVLVGCGQRLTEEQTRSIAREEVLATTNQMGTELEELAVRINLVEEQLFELAVRLNVEVVALESQTATYIGEIHDELEMNLVRKLPPDSTINVPTHIQRLYWCVGSIAESITGGVPPSGLSLSYCDLGNASNVYDYGDPGICYKQAVFQERLPESCLE